MSMGQKDISEKLLEDYNDVFADIVNVLLFDGEEVVSPDALEETKTLSQYKADDSQLHEMERDVAKNWTDEGITIALYGIENQTKAEKIMPLRIFGYEGNSYRSQLLHRAEKKPLYPVVTIILHFGKAHWNQPRNLKRVIPVPERVDQYVNDFKIHVFEISWLSDEQVSKFKSDFRIVAEFFTQMRKNNQYLPSTKEVKHVDEVLKLLSVFGQVEAFEKYSKVKEPKEGKNMGSVIDDMINREIDRRTEKRVEEKAEKLAEEKVQKLVKEKASNLLNSISQLQTNLNLTQEAAIAALGITMETYEQAKAIINQ